MMVIWGLKSLKISGSTVATIGMFDGVHRGHKRILKHLKERSKAINGKSCVLTFEPHPLRVLYPHRTPPMLISTRHKLNLLEAEDIDITAVINFTRSFANTAPSRFAKDVLAERLNVKELLVGENFAFGKGKAGNVANLRRLGQRFGFRVRAIKPIRTGGYIISSTLIRKLIISGELSKAKRSLGRDVSILGTVVKGRRKGKSFGFPTANLDPHHEAIPPSGVYIVKVKMKDREYKGILNIGFRPTFYKPKEEREPVVEVHIFGLKKSIYGQDIEVIFLKKIRSERRFKDSKILHCRIKKDAEIARGFFKKYKS